jgi:hypothetical protein
MTTLYDELRDKAIRLLSTHGLLEQSIRITARALSPEEAIGNPEVDDFPIQKGKERLMQAELNGALGQAFTDRFGDYEGTLEEALSAPLSNNYRRAIFTAALNAGLRRAGVVKGTVHCRDAGPTQCAEALAKHVTATYGNVRIAQVGFQPRMIETLAAHFKMRVLDMDSDNIGARKFGVTIESPEAAADAIDWADLLLVTGTTIVNGTLPEFLGRKPVLFYGTTIAGAASLMGWERFCDASS